MKVDSYNGVDHPHNITCALSFRLP